MNLSITQEVKQTFHLVALRKESKELLTGRQWEHRRALVKRCKEARGKENVLFKERLHTRVAIEQKKLINDAGSKTKQHKPVWAQDDLFDSTASLAQADRNVRAAHENRIERINQYEERGLEALMQSARRENKLENKPTNSFNQKSDRRHGGERRKPSTRKTIPQTTEITQAEKGRSTMDIQYDPKEIERVSSGRESFSGRLLSGPGF